MAVYAYTATINDASGSVPTRGTIAADSPRQARDQLRAQGLTIRDVVEQKPGRGKSLVESYLLSRQKGKVSGLLQEMATLGAADIPLLESLDTISRQHEGRFKQVIMMLRDHVAAGGSLAEAMAMQPELFDDVTLNIVEVGENAGNLEGALSQLVAYRRKAAAVKNRVISAMIYPAIVCGIGVIISIFLMTFVVPKVLSPLVASGKPLPLVTMVAKTISDFLLNWWHVLIALVLLAAIAFRLMLGSERGGMAWDRFLLRVPLLGELIRKQAIARMSMVMATLLRSDVVFVRAVQIAQDTVSNRVLKEALVTCEQTVHAGRDIAEALEKTDAFPPVVIQVFAVGQASGRLEQMLETLSTDYDTQVEITSGRLTAMLEPLMMVLLAVTVGMIAFAVILPILEAGDVL